ncbi:MAG TPA: hypothetical protein VMM18_15550 [Gemmatimonadaceae bacterium]|nr:hypothetical protein [Gemmatimonadaceae bacterium]
MFRIRIAAAALLGAAALAGRAEAQRTALAGDITPYAGFLLTGDFMTGPLETRLSSANGPMYGVQASFPVGNGLSLYGHVGSSQAALEVGIPFLGGLKIGDVSTLVYDGGIRLTLPNTIGARQMVTPFAQVGVGGMRHDITVSVAEYDVLQTKATNFAVNAGIGAHIAVLPGFGVRVLASDYMGKFDVREATSFGLDTKTAHNFGLVAGISIEF